tara:strand:+ start:715 stop:1350 length:636 start_codon:yes stop_codon:yes gene_type:complete
LNYIIKEACVETLDEAIFAQNKGADRIELCSDLALDGLTPSKNLFLKVLNHISIPIKIMIRPRGGNFVYNNKEIKTMIEQIKFFKGFDINGLVFGVLDTDRKIDIDKLQLLVNASEGLDITFHKAIDQVSNLFNEIEILKSFPQISSILTSGCSDSALNGKNTIIKIIDSYSKCFNIIVAGKITNHNFLEIHSSIGANEYHGRKIVGSFTD